MTLFYQLYNNRLVSKYSNHGFNMISLAPEETKFLLCASNSFATFGDVDGLLKTRLSISDTL